MPLFEKKNIYIYILSNLENKFYKETLQKKLKTDHGLIYIINKDHFFSVKALPKKVENKMIMNS